MPRAKYTEILKHTTTADFLAWARNLSNAFKQCLTQTADTGQVNWDNVTTLPGVGQTPHYEIYRFDDAAQAVVPVFIRIEYGSASTTGRPGIVIQAGSNTNGAGAIGGASYLFRNTSLSGVPSDMPVTTYVCYKDGSFTFAWGMNAPVSTTPRLVGVIDRTHDSNGAPTDDGLMTVVGSAGFGGGGVRAFSRRTNVVVQSEPTCLMPVDATGSTNSSAHGVVNLYNWYCPTPDMQYVTALLGYKEREIAKGTEIDVALIGSTARHYVCLGVDGFYGSALNSATNTDTHAILWEV